jgi:hypothetical protein
VTLTIHVYISPGLQKRSQREKKQQTPISYPLCPKNGFLRDECTHTAPERDLGMEGRREEKMQDARGGEGWAQSHRPGARSRQGQAGVFLCSALSGLGREWLSVMKLGSRHSQLLGWMAPRDSSKDAACVCARFKNNKKETNKIPFPIIKMQTQMKSSSCIITKNSYFHKKPALHKFPTWAFLSRETGFYEYRNLVIAPETLLLCVNK